MIRAYGEPSVKLLLSRSCMSRLRTHDTTLRLQACLVHETECIKITVVDRVGESCTFASARRCRRKSSAPAARRARLVIRQSIHR